MSGNIIPKQYIFPKGTQLLGMYNPLLGEPSYAEEAMLSAAIEASLNDPPQRREMTLPGLLQREQELDNLRTEIVNDVRNKQLQKQEFYPNKNTLFQFLWKEGNLAEGITPVSVHLSVCLFLQG